MKPLPEIRTQPPVCLDLVNENSVSPRRRLIENVQERRPGRLRLIRNITVPGNRGRPRLQYRGTWILVRAPVHEVNLGISLGTPARGVDMVFPEVAAVL